MDGYEREKRVYFEKMSTELANGLSVDQYLEIKNDGVALRSGHGEGSFEVNGTGSFEGVVGAYLEVVTYDITDSNNIKKVNTRSINI
ncbi:hypothetical protein ABD74_16700 [Brevibacillus laterosporus]|nr:hypothetical protein [Brevibacillus laterosporus]MBG9789194.1 hypothetical protein [Brevibacillus laterosporus]